MSGNNKILPTYIDEKGRITAEGVSTEATDTQGLEVGVPPRKVVPVIFLPGIMGTHLRLTTQRQQTLGRSSDIAWRPEPMWRAMSSISGAASKQQLLDPNGTEVDRYDPEADKKTRSRHSNVSKVWFVSAGGLIPEYSADANEMARLRGWSEVFYDSYGTLLTTLERQLNRMCRLGKARAHWTEGLNKVIDTDTQAWGGNGGSVLTEPELKKISDAWYPLHAVGYNWLQSNGDSAKHVASRIREIIAQYKAAKFECEKVIIVTHSMGGLVGRALIHPDYGNAQDVVAGIVHGVMPATGVPATYKRMHAGFEGGDSIVLGFNGQQVTSVLANAPGGLELLPSERYPKDWLRITADNQDVLTLPKNDPYTEIYTVTDKWYRLVNPEWVNPAGDDDATLSRTFIYIRKARQFHRKIASSYHPNSYVIYGVDDKNRAWNTLNWQLRQKHVGRVSPHAKRFLNITSTTAAGLQVSEDKGRGDKQFQDLPDQQPYSASLQAAQDPADGTVPVPSATDPIKQGKAKVAFVQSGYDHQNSYKNRAALNATLYGICKIAHDEFKWWGN